MFCVAVLGQGEASCHRKVLYHRPRDEEEDGDDELLRWKRSLYFLLCSAALADHLLCTCSRCSPFFCFLGSSMRGEPRS